VLGSRQRQSGRVPCGRLTETWTDVGGYRMYARVASTPIAREPAIVLAHGYGVSSRYMVPVARYLAPYYHVYAPDLPGYGRSSRPRRVLDVPALADALVAWMAAWRLERAVLLANSFGCQIVTELAVRRPELAAALVLVGPTTDPTARTPWQQAWGMAKDMLREPAPLWPPLARDYLSFGPRRAVVTLRDMLRDRIEERLPQVQAPTLVVRGARDAIVSAAWAAEVARCLPDARLVTIPGAAHAVNFNAPLELTRVVREFLSACDGCAGWSDGTR
jgi:2-hydroxy-6-oxonona-2,4-dienedioate hydrolase